MSQKNPSDYIKPVIQHKADSWAAATHAATGVDTRGFDQALVVLNAGATTTNGSTAVTVQDSADNSTFAAITGAAFTAVTTANDNAIYVGAVRLHGVARYIRVSAVVSNQAIEMSTCVLLMAHEADAYQSVTYAFDV